MTEDDVFEYLLGRRSAANDGTPALAFDTNAIFGDTDCDLGVQVIDAINRANVRRGEAPEVRLVIPAVVLHEKLRQMTQRFGGRFNADLPMNFVRTKNLSVESFEMAHAVEVASRLQRRFPKDGDWRAFKKRRCLACLGLAAGSAPGDGSACGATVDWLIVGHAEAKGYVLVTDDRGPEFDGVTLRASLATTLLAARRLVDQRRA